MWILRVGAAFSLVWAVSSLPAAAPEAWRFAVAQRELRIASCWSPAERPQPLALEFDPRRCEATAIHPQLAGLENDPRLRGFRRNWLNILQLNPRLRVLANHAASDTCAFCLYEYADGMSNDWKAWDGTPWGYEGFLVDNYYALMAVLAREKSLHPPWTGIPSSRILR